MGDDRRNAFGFAPREPGRIEAVRRYLERARYKLRLAEYHLGEFERLERERTTVDFFDFEGEPFLQVQAHADGTVLQAAGAFDAFACALAHYRGLRRPDRADFDGWNEQLASQEAGALSAMLRDTKADPEFSGLREYRNLAAHRSGIAERARGSSDEEGEGDRVVFLLPDWLPPEFPDYPEAEVRPILRRLLAWARTAVDRLLNAAGSTWDLSDGAEDEEPSRAEERTNIGHTPTQTNTSFPSPEQQAPLFGEWRVWFSNSSHNFDTGVTVPDAWRMRRTGEDEHAVSAWGLDVDSLRAWLENLAGPEVAKEALRYFRPRREGTNQGSSLMPGTP